MTRDVRALQPQGEGLGEGRYTLHLDPQVNLRLAARDRTGGGSVQQCLRMDIAVLGAAAAGHPRRGKRGKRQEDGEDLRRMVGSLIEWPSGRRSHAISRRLSSASPPSQSRYFLARSTRSASSPGPPRIATSRTESAPSTPGSATTAPSTTTRGRRRKTAGSRIRFSATSGRSARSAPMSTRSTEERASHRPGTPGLRDHRPDRRHARDRPRRPPVDRFQGDLAFRHGRAEGALSAGPRHGPEARGVRPDGARGGIGRLPREITGGRAGRRLLGPERGEAVIGNGSRADVITTFARAEVDGETGTSPCCSRKG